MPVARARRLAQAIQATYPHSYCYTCLGKRLDMPEKDVRDAAQIVVIQRPGFEVVLRACSDCGRPENLLTYRPAPPSN